MISIPFVCAIVPQWRRSSRRRQGGSKERWQTSNTSSMVLVINLVPRGGVAVAEKEMMVIMP